MIDADEVFVLRNPARKFTYVVWVFFIAVCVFLVIQQPGGAVRASIFGLVFMYLLVSTVRAGVWCNAIGVAVVSEVGWKRRWAWDEVGHFEQRGWRGIGLVNRSGSWVRLTGYATLGDISQEKATELLEMQRHKFQ